MACFNSFHIQSVIFQIEVAGIDFMLFMANFGMFSFAFMAKVCCVAG